MFEWCRELIENQKKKARVRDLIRRGELIPVESFEQYSALVKEAKENAEHRLFTNCYMMQDEIKRLISLKVFYRVNTPDCLAFVDDEGSYYYMFLYVDLEKKMSIPQLDRSVLLEDVFYRARKSKAQEQFEARVQESGFAFINTYHAIVDRPQIAPEKYWKRMKTLEQALEAEGKRIAVPTYKQLKAFEKIYRQEINRFVRKKYTKKERKKQVDEKLLHCVTDNRGEVYAIHISGLLHGGAIAARHDCHDNLYAPALMLNTWKGYYEAMPEDPEQRAEYMRSKTIGGWIAVDNKPSWRLHKTLGLVAGEKSMNQYVLPGFAEKNQK